MDLGMQIYGTIHTLEIKGRYVEQALLKGLDAKENKCSNIMLY